MKKSLLITITALLLLLMNSNVRSQSITFNKVVSPVGSFFGFVGGITQDKNGYMWFATSGGLFRYDGYQFTLFAKDPANKNTLSTTRLETVYADHSGIVWIATWINGLERLDPQTGIFTHFQHDAAKPASLNNDTVRAILEDHDGVLWIGTQGGLDRYDPKIHGFQHYSNILNDPNSLSCNRVRSIYEDRSGTLWVGTGSAWTGEGGETDEGGLNRFDKKTGNFIRYLHDPDNPASLINNKICAIYEDSRGTFWVGTAGDGLHTMNRDAGTFERHRYNPAHPDSLSRPPLNPTAVADYISFIKEDATGKIWIGTVANGINRYDPELQKTTHYGFRDTAAGFTDNSGWCFYTSKEGVVWIGSFEGGLYQVDPFNKSIPYVNIGTFAISFNKDAAGSLWIGTDKGLLLQNGDHEVLKKFVHAPRQTNSLSNDTVVTLYRDTEGILWVGTLNGLNRFDAATNTFTQYLTHPYTATDIYNAPITSIVDAGNDSLWVAIGGGGSRAGLYELNKTTGVYTRYKNNPADTSSLPPYGINSICAADKSGNLWIGWYEGVCYLDRHTGKFKHFLKGIPVNGILKDSRGTLWVATSTGLYNSADPLSTGFAKFTDPGSGMNSMTIACLVEDDGENIWFYSTDGICKINVATGKILVFGKRKLPNISEITNGYKDQQGQIYYGDSHGYYVFFPREVFKNTMPPQITVTDFRIGGKSVLHDGNQAIATSFYNGNAVTLRHDQNVFSFQLSVIHYSNPQYNRQLYKLENYDQTWRDATSEKTAYYYNVPPGDYKLHVKAASSDGVWAEKSIEFIISPPWWRTWWAYTLYALLFISAVYAIHRFQKQRVIAAERERSRVRELAQAKEIEKAYQELKATQAQLIQSEKMASLGELTAGIAHEIQNPLNFVNNFSEVNTELVKELEQELQNGDTDTAKAIASDIKENEEKISYHGHRADAIVKSMLQHSRTNTGQKEPIDINALTDEYLRLSYHGLRAKDKAFNATLKTHFDEHIGNVNVVPQDIGRVLLNLFNNAFYAVSEKKKQASEDYEPTVTVRTKKLADKVQISVEDNGMGISKSLQDKIFQPFFTTKPAGQGTGLGLSLSYDIVKAHHGELLVNSKEGVGTSFLVVLNY